MNTETTGAAGQENEFIDIIPESKTDTNHDQSTSVITKIRAYWENSNENIFALFMAILASCLAINDLIGGRYGDDEIMLTNEKSNQFMWYQSKSIKEYVVKGQVDMFDILIKSGIIKENIVPSFLEQKQNLQENLKRYQKEKQEIMLGSNTVSKENWVQEVDGQLGQVVGAKELERDLKKLSWAGDKFDMASLFFQLSLVIGALGILVKKMQMKKYALICVLALGASGIMFSIKGLMGVL
ncbi:MAG: DUF4337 domain-containing protein [Oligoflexia bacterium]|nr:DUF4337 domain-containing protein [Oligoflexia bacterium]